MNCRHQPATRAAYELRYEPLSAAGGALAFPCDAQGAVSLDALSDSARHHYLFARAVVGRQFASPIVLPSRREPG